MKKLFPLDRYEIKIALIYFLISFVWIFYSDRLINNLVDDQALLLSLQTYKGWAFVLVTTFVLYFFIRRDALKLRDSRKRIKELLREEKSSRQQTEQEKEKLEEILLEVPSAICILEGPEHQFTYANEAYRQLVGIDRELKGKPAREALPEVAGQGFFELLDGVYETGEIYKGDEVPFTIDSDEEQHTYYRNFIYKPLFDDEGKCSGIFVEAVDVTKQVEIRKRLEKSNEEKQILLSELHHRVKNNLALIIGLIELEMEEYQQSFHSIPLQTTRNRIFTIAEIHEVLFQQQSLKDIPFHNFLDRLRDILFNGNGRNGHPDIEINCDSLKLNINQAVPLGLMINEILSRLTNGNGTQPCKAIKLSLNIDDKNEVITTLDIQQLDEEIKEKLIKPEEYLPATLINVLTQQLEATLNHTKGMNRDIFKIQFKKEHKKGGASSL